MSKPEKKACPNCGNEKPFVKRVSGCAGGYKRWVLECGECDTLSDESAWKELERAKSIAENLARHIVDSENCQQYCPHAHCQYIDFKVDTQEEQDAKCVECVKMVAHYEHQGKACGNCAYRYNPLSDMCAKCFEQDWCSWEPRHRETVQVNGSQATCSECH